MITSTMYFMLLNWYLNSCIQVESYQKKNRPVFILHIIIVGSTDKTNFSLNFRRNMLASWQRSKHLCMERWIDSMFFPCFFKKGGNMSASASMDAHRILFHYEGMVLGTNSRIGKSRYMYQPLKRDLKEEPRHRHVIK